MGFMVTTVSGLWGLEFSPFSPVHSMFFPTMKKEFTVIEKKYEPRKNILVVYVVIAT